MEDFGTTEAKSPSSVADGRRIPDGVVRPRTATAAAADAPTTSTKEDTQPAEQNSGRQRGDDGPGRHVQ